ncbi:MAG: sodium:proton antiporter, partial [Eubacterium sp.]|nr:sodium:proton antiporter [Eubacterium sp.]
MNSLTVVTCIAMNIILPDQYLGISVPGQMYEEEYKKRNIDSKELASMLLGGGVVTSPLIPWNTCGIYCMTMLGVMPTEYAPFAFYCLLLPVVMIILSLIRNRKPKTA